MNKYKAILIAGDGQYVTDFRGKDSIEEVWECVENMGSRWIFYPFVFIIVDHGSGYSSGQKIVSASEEMHNMVGLTVDKVRRMFSLQ